MNSGKIAPFLSLSQRKFSRVKPCILLTNDDGVDAEGLSALRRALPQPEVEVYIVAPKHVMSECGHRVTTKDVISVGRREDKIFVVDGTPADCVRLALTELLPRAPSLVLSGINHGGNLGADIYISGTVAAAREAAFFRVPAIAFSHYKILDRAFDWEWAARCAFVAMSELLERCIVPGEYWNVNLPHVPPGEVPPRVHCSPGRQPLPVRYRSGPEGYAYSGVYAQRESEPGSDVEICFGGGIAISRLVL